jgi:hypothetical protein
VSWDYRDHISEPEFVKDLGVQPIVDEKPAARGAEKAPAEANGKGEVAAVPKPRVAPKAVTAAVATALSFKPLREFASVREPSAEALLGDERNAVLPAGGLLLMYGDGGAGKTTATLDATAHMAAGTPWLGLPVERPIRIVLVENEGPRGKFRDKLDAKLVHWPGTPESADNILVLEEPWSLFSFANEPHREQLRAAIIAHKADLVVLGPVVRLGVEGGGTPAELADFLVLLELVRANLERPVAYWLVHHENKQGDVSGAWSGIPDTIAHVQAQGNGRTRIVWEKVRWGSDLHGTSWNLTWADGASFRLEDARVRDLYAELPAKLAENPANPWLTNPELATLLSANKDAVRAVASDLTDRGTLEFQIGPPGRGPQARCWRLRTGSDTSSHPELVGLFPGGERATGSTGSPLVEGRVEGASPLPPREVAHEPQASPVGEAS